MVFLRYNAGSSFGMGTQVSYQMLGCCTGAVMSRSGRATCWRSVSWSCLGPGVPELPSRRLDEVILWGGSSRYKTHGPHVLVGQWQVLPYLRPLIEYVSMHLEDMCLCM